MQRVAAIAFLLVFLFNVGGYYFLFYGLTYQSNKKLAQRFDNEEYSDSETITLAIPISLPYPLFTDDYQRITGDFDYNGEHYKLIKQKLEGDTLYVVCYKDHASKRIKDAFSDFAKFSNDLPLSSKNSLTFMGKLMKDYEPVQQPRLLQNSGWSIGTTYATSVYHILTIDLPVFSPPPEQVI